MRQVAKRRFKPEDAYRLKAAADPDPWLERHDPVHPKQFAELDSEPEPLTPIDAVLADTGTGPRAER